MNLLTSITYDILPFLKEKNVSLEHGLMLTDIKLCQSINEESSEKLEVLISTFKVLNQLLVNFLVLEEKEISVFDVSSDNALDKILNNPKWFARFIKARLGIYEKYRPELLQLLAELSSPAGQ